MSIKLKFEGGRELEAALSGITAQATRKNVARRALRAAAEPILGAYKSATTVLTGHLRLSSIVGTRLNRRQSRLNRGQKMPVEVYVGTNDPAGLQEEFGNRHQAAKGNLRKAWDSVGGERALAVIRREMWREIAAAAGRQARRIARRG